MPVQTRSQLLGVLEGKPSAYRNVALINAALPLWSPDRRKTSRKALQVVQSLSIAARRLTS